MDTLKLFRDRLPFQTMNEWYNRSDVKFEMIKYTYNREFALLVPSFFPEDIKKNSVRMLKCHSVQHFDYITKKGVRMWEKMIPFNMYYSLARYKDGIPNQTFNFSERDNKLFQENHFNEIMDYDFLLDIDAGDFEDILDAHYSALELKKFFDLTDTPYEVRFSGKGFHFIIPYIYFFEYNNNFNPGIENNIYQLYSRIAKKLRDNITEMLDVTIYDSRRICKLPFSLAIYPEGVLVAYPFDDKNTLENFHLGDFRVENFNLPVRKENPFIFNKKGSVKKLMEMI